MDLSRQAAETLEANTGLVPEPLVAPEPPSAEELDKERKQSRLKKLGGILVPLALLASKAKVLFLAVIKVKAVATLGTMFVSIVAYGLAFGWPFAVGFVLLLFVHEMGHVIQLRREGVEASAPIFVPFVGALITTDSLGKDAVAEARVGLAGPILGTAATLVPLAIWLATGSDLWRALAYVGFFINLINLLPVLPLDGGRAMAVLGPMVWLAGILTPSPPPSSSSAPSCSSSSSSSAAPSSTSASRTATRRRAAPSTRCRRGPSSPSPPSTWV
jgi:Zn-dependent protease